MKAITAIYNAPIVIDNFDQSISRVGIEYNGKTYIGFSYLHPQDKDFQSEKIGKNIALSRARIYALQYEYNKAKIEAQIKRQMYLELGENSNAFMHKNMMKAVYRSEVLRKELKFQKQYLKDYLNSQQDFIDKILKTRARANSDKKS